MSFPVLSTTHLVPPNAKLLTAKQKGHRKIVLNEGWINLTKLLKHQKIKVTDWLSLHSTTLDNLASSIHQTPIKIVTDGVMQGRGTYIHPSLTKLALDSLAPKYRKYVEEVLDELKLKNTEFVKACNETLAITTIDFMSFNSDDLISVNIVTRCLKTNLKTSISDFIDRYLEHEDMEDYSVYNIHTHYKCDTDNSVALWCKFRQLHPDDFYTRKCIILFNDTEYTLHDLLRDINNLNTQTTTVDVEYVIDDVFL